MDRIIALQIEIHELTDLFDWHAAALQHADRIQRLKIFPAEHALSRFIPLYKAQQSFLVIIAQGIGTDAGA